jgi:hypothetical protein
MEDIDGLPLPFLPSTISLRNNITYTLLKPLTNFKSCHDGTPSEARILFTCRQSTAPANTPDNELIVKIKVQIPTTANPNPEPHEGPSDTTAHELRALEIFRSATSAAAPHLVAFHCSVQPETGRVPGGYITYTVMNKAPGSTLFALGYWNLTVEEREEISRAFLIKLREVYALGVEPVDRGLRNVLWDKESKTWYVSCQSAL